MFYVERSASAQSSRSNSSFEFERVLRTCVLCSLNVIVVDWDAARMLALALREYLLKGQSTGFSTCLRK